MVAITVFDGSMERSSLYFVLLISAIIAIFFADRNPQVESSSLMARNIEILGKEEIDDIYSVGPRILTMNGYCCLTMNNNPVAGNRAIPCLKSEGYF
jgi:hypothetical protein